MMIYERLMNGGGVMYASMETISVLDDTEQLANMLNHSDVFHDYLTCKERMAKDAQSQALIHNFLKTKEKYDEVQRFGRYHPDYKSVIQEMMEVKRNLDLNETVAAYKEAEERVQDLLNSISVQIARAVSESIMVPTGDPFFDKQCAGGCSTGGACGCH
ncbi:YlbF family regulator [Terrilactibacillus laevilacticus]|uniref:YlbF family regulator n=1 Tax=Terrilactibacillus laevilacticus TaxID=1380157 RepID=UPI001FE3D61F|nr:YlbF family regulator [Terrilactibacillus laevilacticus]